MELVLGHCGVFSGISGVICTAVVQQKNGRLRSRSGVVTSLDGRVAGTLRPVYRTDTLVYLIGAPPDIRCPCPRCSAFAKSCRRQYMSPIYGDRIPHPLLAGQGYPIPRRFVHSPGGVSRPHSAADRRHSRRGRGNPSEDARADLEPRQTAHVCGVASVCSSGEHAPPKNSVTLV